jgi:hypothetical protein
MAEGEGFELEAFARRLSPGVPRPRVFRGLGWQARAEILSEQSESKDLKIMAEREGTKAYALRWS